MKHKKKFYLTIGIIFLLFIIFISHSHHHKTNLPLVNVTTGTIIEKAEATGYIIPQHTTSVKSQIDGNVAEIYHDAGDYVTAGEPLLKINPTYSPNTYAQDVEQVEITTANLQSAAKDLARYETAIKNKLISSNYTDYITAKQTYDSAKLKNQLAIQNLALLKQGKTLINGEVVENVVTSPINGYILTRDVDIGDAVLSISSAQSATELFSIANMSDLMFQGQVDESDANKIHNGMPAIVKVGALPGQLIKGVLTQVALQSEQESDTSDEDNDSSVNTSPFNVGFQVQVTQLAIPKNVLLRSGFSATAEITIGVVKNVPILPERVIYFNGDQAYVLLPSKKAGNQPRQHDVQVGASDGINVQILKGLTVGDKVVDQLQGTDNES